MYNPTDARADGMAGWGIRFTPDTSMVLVTVSGQYDGSLQLVYGKGAPMVRVGSAFTGSGTFSKTVSFAVDPGVEYTLDLVLQGEAFNVDVVIMSLPY
jgi:hypothetical protein